jgi:hypothetical protein
MYVYSYHYNSKKFLGVGKATLSPLDQKWVLPAYSTVIPCPDEPLEQDYYYVWSEEENKWNVVYEQPAVATGNEVPLDPPIDMDTIIEETVVEALGTETNPVV